MSTYLHNVLLTQYLILFQRIMYRQVLDPYLANPRGPSQCQDTIFLMLGMKPSHMILGEPVCPSSHRGFKLQELALVIGKLIVIGPSYIGTSYR